MIRVAVSHDVDPKETMSGFWPSTGANRRGDLVIRIGVLTPHAAIGPEEEFVAMAPGRLATEVVRIPTEAGLAGAGSGAPTTPAELRALMEPLVLDEAAKRLADSIDAVGHASTTSAYAVGFDQEAEMVSRLSALLAVPVAATCVSAVLALRALAVERVALVGAPWFDAELNDLGAAYFRSQGFDVVSSASAELSQEPDRIASADVVKWTARHVSDDAEGVFIGGNGFRAVAAIEPLEASIGRPVLTSNQVLLWNLLARVGASFEINGFGQLFAYEARSAS
jgi:maleate isomerase